MVDGGGRHSEVASCFPVAVFFSVCSYFLLSVSLQKFFSSASWAGMDLLYLFFLGHFLNHLFCVIDVYTSLYIYYRI